MDYVYLDNDAATRVDDEVIKAMLPYMKKDYGMASSEFGHSFGVSGRNAISEAKKIIAKEINATPEEIYFTSGVAESNNTAIHGALAMKRGDMISSTIEQNTVRTTINELAKHAGVDVIKIPVDKEGFVDLKALEKALTKNISIVSIQHANQEIGTIQDIAKIGNMCRKLGVSFHSDASHSFMRVPIDVEAMGIDLMTLSAHDIYGPKGVAVLYIRKGVDIAPLLFGGGEQNGIRPGLENVPAIVGFGKAVEIYDKKDNVKMGLLRDYLIKGLLKIKETRLNGSNENRICNNVNMTFKFVEGEALLLHLDLRKIAVTTGSACFSRDLVPSHVIMAMGLSHGDAHGSVRFSLSKYNTKEEIDYVVKNVKEVVEKLREISPFGA